MGRAGTDDQESHFDGDVIPLQSEEQTLRAVWTLGALGEMHQGGIGILGELITAVVPVAEFK